jgi:A/G-specific adenine glycosylase
MYYTNDLVLIHVIIDCSTCHELQSDLSEEAYAVTRYPLKVDKKPPRDEGKIVS